MIPLLHHRAEAAVAAAALAALSIGVVTAGVRTPPAVKAKQSQEVSLKTWQAQVQSETLGLGGYTIALVSVYDAWVAGTVPASTVATDLDQALPYFRNSRAQLAKQPALAGAPTAIEDYRQAVDLYTDAATVARIATSLPAGPLLKQLQLSFSRMRTLADRTFDQADAALAPLEPPDPAADSSDVTVVAPLAVPNWASVGLAAGPPLDIPPPTYLVQRPGPRTARQPFTAWAAALKNTGLPSAGTERQTIQSGTTQQLQTLADYFNTSSLKMGITADPAGKVLDSTRVRIGLLVDEEAARTAEAATLLTGSLQAQTKTLAEKLAVTGDQLWDPQLGARSTGFPTSLLTAD